MCTHPTHLVCSGSRGGSWKFFWEGHIGLRDAKGVEGGVSAYLLSWCWAFTIYVTQVGYPLAFGFKSPLWWFYPTLSIDRLMNSDGIGETNNTTLRRCLLTLRDNSIRVTYSNSDITKYCSRLIKQMQFCGHIVTRLEISVNMNVWSRRSNNYAKCIHEVAAQCVGQSFCSSTVANLQSNFEVWTFLHHSLMGGTHFYKWVAYGSMTIL